MECLDDRDESIRRRALDLISGMVSKKTLPDIVKKLMTHMNETESACEFYLESSDRSVSISDDDLGDKEMIPHEGGL